MALVSYNFDFKKLISWLLPPLKRKSIWEAWLFALAKKLRAIHAEFVAFHIATKDSLKWNGQTISLENLLVSKFGAGIYITSNINDVFPFYIYEVNNADNPFIYEVNNAANPTVDDVNAYDLELNNFIVNVPVALVFNQDEMEATINKYKLYGTKYAIVTY